MSRVTMIQHINIQISDREQSREWYEKVLGAEFMDRGPELNQGQLQLRIGSGEMIPGRGAGDTSIASGMKAVRTLEERRKRLV